MRVVGLCSFPNESAATRFRMDQFVAPLLEVGIDLTVSPFLNNSQFRLVYRSGNRLRDLARLFWPILDRFGLALTVRSFDLIFIQREALFFGPGFFEWLYQFVGNRSVILDLDDATYVPYVSPKYGWFGSLFKFFGKTDKLIDRAAVVTCGNRFIAEYVEARGTRAVVIPTVVDTDQFCPIEHHNVIPLIGWIGTHSTYQFLERLFPVFQRLATKHKFVLKIVGSGRTEIDLPGVDVELVDWSLDREVSDFQDMDIGLYPIFPGGSANADWIKGKSGFKAIQYMAVGVPFVMSPVGVCAAIGEPGKTHFNAETDDDWYNSLSLLLTDASLRKEMGKTGRQYSLEHFDMKQQAEKLAEVFRSVVG